MQKNKGFTLIELLVVIAIIGILASIVLASLSTARQKGADAKIQAQISNMRAQAELYYNSQVPPSYGAAVADGDCESVVEGNIFTAATGLDALVAGLATPVCNSTATTWAVSHVLSNTTDYFCADSTGVAAVGPNQSLNTGLCGVVQP